MADNKGKCVISFGGGWATDFGPAFTNSPSGNSLSIPFLLNAENVVFELDGGPHKVGGAQKLNTVQVTESGSGVPVHGLIDVWFQGTAGTETQKRFAYIGTKLLKEDVDGTWDVLNTGLETDKIPAFEIFKDLVFWASTSTVDVPKRWDGSAGTASNVGGTPPQFAFMVKHKNRMFAAGVASQPSRLYYSVDLDPNSWVAAGSGSIDIDPDDGDRITGLVTHKNELLIFKGPHRLSIHRITGSSPTGADAYARVPFVTGVGGVNHNTIFRVGDDLVFASPRGLHSLAATAAYGDYVEAFLSRPILTYYQDDLNHAVLHNSWGVNYQAKGLALWTFAKAGGTTRDVLLAYDYRFQPGRWVKWDSATGYLAANCLAVLEKATSRKHRLFAGTTSGYVYELDDTARRIDSGTAYTADVKLPFINLGSSAILKTVEDGFLSLNPKGSYTTTVGWTRDRNAEQTVAVSQTSGDVLG